MPGEVSAESKKLAYVEIQLPSKSTTTDEAAAEAAAHVLHCHGGPFRSGSVRVPPDGLVQSLSLHIPAQEEEAPLSSLSLAFRPYRLGTEPSASESLGAESTTALETWDGLPHADFTGLWDALCFDQGDDFKEELLSFAGTTIRLADAGVSPACVNFNRILLLHGPPGTGKTTLCRAVAQKLAIRMRPRFPRTALAEINAHSLFSKWFSESGKMVQSLFEKIELMLQDPDCLVCLLFDEVESLCASRSASLASSEPSDGVRAVNAVLTRLDALRRWPNVLVLATSNLLTALDPAFLDRVDLARACPLPALAARKAILRSCLKELQKKGVVEASDVEVDCSDEARAAEGLSGRALRKLPVLALANVSVRFPGFPIPLQLFKKAMQSEATERSLL